MLAVKESDGDTNKLRKLARALVEAGAAGDVSALREIGDRLDGKPKQETDLTINDNRDPNSIPDAELAAIVAQDGSGDDAAPQGGTGVVH